MSTPAKHKLSWVIWTLTWPLIVANGLDLVTGLVDFRLVRPFGQSATATIGVVRQVTTLVEAMAATITAGVVALVSQGVGAGGHPVRPVESNQVLFRPEDVLRQSMVLMVLIGVPIAFAGCWLSGPLLVGLQTSSATRDQGEAYLQVYFAGILFTWGNLVATAVFRGAGDVWTPLKVALGTNVLQVGLNYLLIHGGGPLPAFGVRGAALGLVSARACGTVTFLFLLHRGAGPARLRWARSKGAESSGAPIHRGFLDRLGLDWKLLGSLLRIGMPMALANVLRHGSRVVFLAIAGFTAPGVALQAAVGIALQFRLLGVLVALAFQTASATLVGQAVGRDDFAQAAALGRRSIHLLGLVMSLITGILIVFADPLVSLFFEPSQGTALGARVVRWFAVAQFFSALSIGTQGPLLGAGDTLPAMRYTLVSEWCLMLPLSGVLVWMTWVPDGLLIAWVLAPALTLVLMLRRFRSGHWQNRRVERPAT